MRDWVSGEHFPNVKFFLSSFIFYLLSFIVFCRIGRDGGVGECIVSLDNCNINY